MNNNISSYVVGVDVGGTFTDFLWTCEGEDPRIYKTLSTPLQLMKLGRLTQRPLKKPSENYISQHFAQSNLF